MFKVIRYIKKNGIRRTIQVINEYKLDKAVNKLVALITRNIPLKDYIVIESHDDFDCNGGAFYDYLIEHGYNKKYKMEKERSRFEEGNIYFTWYFFYTWGYYFCFI